jgi:hypothetical protein
VRLLWKICDKVVLHKSGKSRGSYGFLVTLIKKTFDFERDISMKLEIFDVVDIAKHKPSFTIAICQNEGINIA